MHMCGLRSSTLCRPTSYAGTQGEGLFKSDDYGETWNRLSGLPINVQGIAVDPRNDNELFVAAVGAGVGGVFRSHDQGLTWEKVLNRVAWNIIIVGGDSPVVYVTTKTEGVYRGSIDGSNPWEPINNGITDLNMGRAAPVMSGRTTPKCCMSAARVVVACTEAAMAARNGSP